MTIAEEMRHAIGVEPHPYKGDTYSAPTKRNHFVGGGSEWDAVVSQGLATRSEGSSLTGGDPVYSLTASGREHALAGIDYKRKWGYGRPVHL